MKTRKTLKAVLAVQNTDAFIAQLMRYVYNPNAALPGRRFDEAASSMVKVVSRIRALDLEVCSGGIALWILNVYCEHKGLPDHRDALDLLKMIGAKSCVDYLNAASKLFPGGRIPEDLDKAEAVCDEKEREFYKLDDKYSSAIAEAIECLRKYIAAHFEQFEQELRAFWKLAESQA